LTDHNKLTQFVTELKNSVNQNTFISLNLANYKGSETDLKKIIIRKITVKKVENLSFTYRYKTRDIVKNFGISESLEILNKIIGSDFKTVTLFTSVSDWFYDNSSKEVLKKLEPSKTDVPDTAHNKTKNRLLDTENSFYLALLGITDTDGNVFPKSQDKYKQINRYIEILSTHLNHFSKDKKIHIADMGAGKGYLTFALYHYLKNKLQLMPAMIGVEFRKDLVDLCNEIAIKVKFDDLKFIEGDISHFKTEAIDILIALHACDTATDEAIWKGIEGNAKLIVVAPCCHKQIRREIENGKTNNQLQFITQYGIFLERQAEMVTDGIRALILNYFGYQTKAVEFISDIHTPKNVMIIAEKSEKPIQKEVLLKQLNSKSA
jgi:SAM-dependent methyltransferase